MYAKFAEKYCCCASSESFCAYEIQAKQTREMTNRSLWHCQILTYKRALGVWRVGKSSKGEPAESFSTFSGCLRLPTEKDSHKAVRGPAADSLCSLDWWIMKSGMTFLFFPFFLLFCTYYFYYITFIISIKLIYIMFSKTKK